MQRSASAIALDACPPARAGQPLGSVAYRREGALAVFDLDRCRERVLVATGAAEPIRWSADGAWIAFGGARVVPARGGHVRAPLGGEIVAAPDAWTWSPRGHVLAAISEGGLVVGGPGRATRRLLPSDWGATSLAFLPSGDSVAVARSRYPSDPAANYHQEIWLVHLASGDAELVYSVPPGQVAPPRLAGVSPDGRWVLFWPAPQSSNSLAADGMPLFAKRLAAGAAGQRVVRSMLLYRDYLAWCGARLAVAAGAGRTTTHAKRIRVAAPPLWQAADASRDRSRSWVSPACSPARGWIATAARASRLAVPFGRERRSIWLLGDDGSRRRQLTRAPRGASDELPRWSRDGRWVLFVRTRPSRAPLQAAGRLFLARVGPGGRPQGLFGPLARLGPASNYYGHYSWATATDWYKPAARPAARPFTLYTHCGVLSAWIDGELWLADPPLTDGSGNPPPGWDNPTDRGTLRKLSRNRAVFRSRSGKIAYFTRAKPGTPDPAEGCA